MADIDYLSQDHYQNIQEIIRENILNQSISFEDGLKLSNYIGVSYIVNLGMQTLSSHYPIYGAKHEGRFVFCDLDLLDVTDFDKAGDTTITYSDTGETATVPIRELAPSIMWSNFEKELEIEDELGKEANSFVDLVDQVDRLQFANEAHESRIAELEMANVLLRRQLDSFTSAGVDDVLLEAVEDFQSQPVGTACSFGHAVYVKTAPDEWMSTRNSDKYSDERLSAITTSAVSEITGFTMAVLRKGWHGKSSQCGVEQEG